VLDNKHLAFGHKEFNPSLESLRLAGLQTGKPKFTFF
jgi:hypothetical protein